jgi:hypothetical protein
MCIVNMDVSFTHTTFLFHFKERNPHRWHPVYISYFNKVRVKVWILTVCIIVVIQQQKTQVQSPFPQTCRQTDYVDRLDTTKNLRTIIYITQFGHATLFHFPFSFYIYPLTILFLFYNFSKFSLQFLKILSVISKKIYNLSKTLYTQNFLIFCSKSRYSWKIFTLSL